MSVRRDYESLYGLGVALTAYAAAEAVGGSGFYEMAYTYAKATTGRNTVRRSQMTLPGGKVVTIATTAANQQLTQDTPISQSEFNARRVSWRELVVE